MPNRYKMSRLFFFLSNYKMGSLTKWVRVIKWVRIIKWVLLTK